MTVGGRLVVAGGCAAAGMLFVWAVYRAAPQAVIEARSPTDVRTAAVPPVRHSTLWILAVGVSRYQDEQLSLRFADADAAAFADALTQRASSDLYASARSVVLVNEEATRERILSHLEGLVDEAGPGDVVAVFLAGHGVREHSNGGYYFLPYAASTEDLAASALHISDLDGFFRALRRNVSGVMVVLDTCHAGALRPGTTSPISADELATQMSLGEGFFLLAASRPGEESKEGGHLGHGVLTHALLEGLGGPADTDRDGFVSVSEIFAHAAQRVPRLTENEQHPYHRMEGTNLIFATIAPDVTPDASEHSTASLVSPHEVTSANTIGVGEFIDLRGDATHRWIGNALRVAFNTELSKVRALRVYTTEMLDQTARDLELDDLSTARHLGIRKLVSGSYYVIGEEIRIDAQIIDASTGVQEGSDSVQGGLRDFLGLEKRLVLSMLRRLPVRISRLEGESIRKRTNTDIDAFRLLLESEGMVEEAVPGEGPPSSGSQAPDKDLPLQPETGREGSEAEGLSKSNGGAGRSWSFSRSFAGIWGSAAYAVEPTPDVHGHVSVLLDAYREALETESTSALAALYVSYSDRQRSALAAYFQNADQLQVEVDDVTIEPHRNGISVSFIRRDHFIDHKTGRRVDLEVRLSKILVRQGGQWKFER